MSIDRPRARATLSLLATLSLAACGGGGGGGGNGGNPNPPANRAPVATAAAYVTDRGSALDADLAASDADGDSLSFAVSTQPANGSVSLSGNGNRSFRYVPDGGYSGPDSFAFTASDGTATSAAATIAITVNSKPTVSSADYETNDITSLSATLQADDVEGDALTFSVSADPQFGTVTITDSATGEFVYVPDSGADGTDTFSVVAEDDFQSSAAATITVEIFGWPGTLQIGTAETDTASTQGLAIDDDRSLFISGNTSGVLDGQSSAGGRDTFLQRRDRRAALSRSEQNGTPDDDLMRAVLNDPLSGAAFIVTDYDLRKIDATGQALWARTPAWTGQLSTGYSYRSAVDAAGDLYVIHLGDPNTDPRSGLEKYSGVDGTLLWTRSLDSSVSNPADPWIDATAIVWARGLAFDGVGNLVVSGNSFGHTTATCGDCGFLAKLDADTGADLWLRAELAYEEPGCNSPDLRLYRPTVDASGDIIVNGIATDQGNFSDVVLVGFDATGVRQWSYCDESTSGDAYTFTESEPLSGGDLVTMADQAVDADGSAVLVLYRHATDGTLVWRRELTLEDTDGTPSIIFHGDLVIDADDVIYLSLTTSGDAGGNTNAGQDDVVVMRFDADGMLR